MSSHGAFVPGLSVAGLNFPRGVLVSMMRVTSDTIWFRQKTLKGPSRPLKVICGSVIVSPVEIRKVTLLLEWIGEIASSDGSAFVNHWLVQWAAPQ